MDAFLGGCRPSILDSSVSREDPMARSRKRLNHGAGSEPERRRSCRYPARIKTAVLSWDADGSRVEILVELDDISMHGCRVSSRVCPAPKPGESIWFQAPAENPGESIEGVMLSTVKPFLGKHTTRVKFLTSLPFHTFKLLVYGPEGMDLDRAERPEHEADYIWR